MSKKKKINNKEKIVKSINNNIRSSVRKLNPILKGIVGKKVDVAIIETGLGGRLDSTNVLNPNLSIITSIDIDHQNILGNTIEEIANEKAGIIKKNTPLITFKQSKKILDILRNRAKTLNAKIEIVVDPQKIVVDNFSTKFVINNKTFSIPLIGSPVNIST